MAPDYSIRGHLNAAHVGKVSKGPRAGRSRGNAPTRIGRERDDLLAGQLGAGGDGGRSGQGGAGGDAYGQTLFGGRAAKQATRALGRSPRGMTSSMMSAWSRARIGHEA